MPIYEYVCQDCGEKYEKLVRSSTAKVELVCPKCSSPRGIKALSLFGSFGGGSSSEGAFGSGRAAAPACGPIG